MQVRDLRVSAKDIRWPERDVRDLRVRAQLPGQGRPDVRGGVRGGSGEVDVALDRMGLTPFNAYATSYGGIAIDTGATTLATKLTLTPARIEADNRIVIHQLGVSSRGQSVVPGVGVPIDLALALLRDPSGDITLPVPVAVERGKPGVRIGEIVGGAVKAALLGALQSPLKGLGLVAGARPGGADRRARGDAGVATRPRDRARGPRRPRRRGRSRRAHPGRADPRRRSASAR